jgi:hypothetical protein
VSASSFKCPQCGLVKWSADEECKRCARGYQPDEQPKKQKKQFSTAKLLLIVGGCIVALLVVAIVALATIIAHSQRRQDEEIAALRPKCAPIAVKIQMRNVYEEIDLTDMAEFDSIDYRDPRLVEPRILHEYIILDKYSRDHDTTLSRMTFMDRRKVLLDDAVKSGIATSEGLTPDERDTFARCDKYGIR